MDVRRIEDPAEFLDTAGPLLLEDEARHNLILGIVGILRDRPQHYPEFNLWVVERDGRVLAAALQTPPFNLTIARPATDEAYPALTEAIASDGIDLPGVTAAVPEVERFADAWERRSRTNRRRRMAQRIYRLTEVRPVTGVSGGARHATAADKGLLVEWMAAFVEEAMAESPGDDVERGVDARLSSESAGFALWEDGRPVSMAAWGGETPHGVRISAVYTPPELRRRGYASAVTAAVSAERLASGRRFCFLYTDLANPTSNKIYVDIGYEPVCDSLDYTFEQRS